jgi:hypothetical protein
LSYVAFGVGGAGLVTGAVTGAFFLHERSVLKGDCKRFSCPSSSADNIDKYHTYGTVSGVALAVGVAGLGAGLALFLTEPKSEDSASAKPRVRPLLGLGMVGAEGTF